MDATYRAELRQFNELNFARFDAKLEQRIGEVKADIAALKAEFRAEMDTRFAAADAKLEQRIGGLQAELRSEIAALRADLIKWMFVFVATATLAILGLG